MTAVEPNRPLAVITGASSGIGFHLAEELARRGCDLVVCADDDAIHQAASAMQELGAQVEVVQTDLATRDGVEELLRVVEGRAHPVEILCLNAGVGNAGPFVETSLEDDLRLLELNVVAPVLIAKRLLPAMVGNGGRVLVTSSIAGIMPGPWYATYAASKSFLLSFAEAVRYELRDSGVTVTALMPGPTDTNFFDRAGMEDTVANSMPKDDPADVARDGIEALFDNEDHVVAHSWRNKLQAALGKGLPEPVKARVHAGMTHEKG